MAKDLMGRLRSLEKQAKEEHSHYYTASLIDEAIERIEALELHLLKVLKAIEKTPENAATIEEARRVYWEE